MPQKNSKILERVYRLISLRQRSEKEIRDYFSKKQYSDLVIEETVKKLKELRLLDDEQFAKDWVQSRSKKLGPKALKQELFQKGISKDIIEGVIGFRENEEEVAQRILEKKVRIWNGLPPLEFKKKAFGFLGRRGFEYEIVSKAVEKYLKKDYN